MNVSSSSSSSSHDFALLLWLIFWQVSDLEGPNDDDDDEDEFGDGGEEQSVSDLSEGEEGDSGNDTDDDDDDDADDDDDDEGGGGFLSGGKGESFAKAFQKVMRQADARIQRIQSDQVAQGDRGTAVDPTESHEGSGPSAAMGRKHVPILAGSVALKQAQEDTKAKLEKTRAARLLRLQMKRRGHVKVSRRGQNIERDSREKSLSKLATKGVVRLFNAIYKAQKDAEKTDRGKPAGLMAKQSVFRELQKEREKRHQAETVVGVKPAFKKHEIGGGGEEGQETADVAWGVLRGDADDGSTMKMKDWDKAELENEDDGGQMGVEEGLIEGEDDDSGEEGW